MDSPFDRPLVPDRPDHVGGRYTGEAPVLFSLALRTGLLTLLTLGIYRFWAKTRIRTYIWSSIDMAGTRFEYTGTGLEKFLGFLVAVVLLAIYLGVMQMLLFFFGIVLFREPESEAELIAQLVGGSLTGAAILPFLYFAVYRARRYKLARTRWRGIRFGMEQGAWGYALRAMIYGAVTLLSVGLLLPLASFRLEKYMTDRSWFGDARFVQEGRWTALYGAMKHLLIGIGLLVLALGLAAAGHGGWSALGFIAGPIWLVFGYVHYNVQSFAYLATHKRLGPEINFAAAPRTGTVIRTYLLGTLAVGLVTAIAFGLLGTMTGARAIMDFETYDGPGLATVILGAVGYLVILIGAGAGALAMITQPILQHYVETITLANPAAFDAITQRAADQGADAEGFADALDIGGAI